MNVGVLLFHEVHELDVVGPYTVLHTAKTMLEENDLEVFTVAKSRNSVQTSGDLTITPLYAFASAPQVDALFVPGGKGVDKAVKDKPLQLYLERTVPSLKHLLSVSSGSILLGELGYVRNQTVTTHHDVLERLKDYEALSVANKRIVKSEGLWSSAAMASGMDLALEFVKEVFDEKLAKRVAVHLGLA